MLGNQGSANEPACRRRRCLGHASHRRLDDRRAGAERTAASLELLVCAARRSDFLIRSRRTRLSTAIDAFGRALIVEALGRFDGNLTLTAQALKIPTSTLDDTMKKHALIAA